MEAKKKLNTFIADLFCAHWLGYDILVKYYLTAYIPMRLCNVISGSP